MEYLIELALDVKIKEFRSKINLTHDKHPDNLKEFFIHENTEINSILVNDSPVKWFTEDIEHPFIPDADKLVLKSDTLTDIDGPTNIELDIKGHIDITTYDINQISDDYIELNIYSPWYPLPIDLRSSKATTSISGLEEFYLLKGRKDENDKRWHLELEGTDNYIIAFRQPQLEELQLEVGLIRLINSRVCEKRDLIKGSIEEILDYYNDIFSDKVDSQRELNVVIAPRKKGSAYCRPDLIVMTEAEMPRQRYEMILAHELSHIWFTGAEVASWEDWLNESFAEYCSLLYIEEKYGREPYKEAIKKMIKDTKNCPPIKGSDRTSEEGAKIRYKGTVLLHELREQFGLDIVKEIFNQLCQLEVKTTDNLIDKLEGTNQEVARFLAEKIIY